MDDLQRAFTTLPDGAGPGPDCSDPERIFAAATGQGPAAELIDHVTTCPWCAMVWGLARETDADAAVVSLSAERRHRALPWVGLGLAMAAAVLLVVRSPEQPVYRSAGGAAVVSLVDETTPLSRQAFTLSWLGEGTWDVTLSTTDLSVVARKVGLTEPRWTVPAAALADVPDGTRLVCSVQAEGQGPRGSFFVVVGP